MDNFDVNDMKILLEDCKPKYQTGDYITGKLVISVNDVQWTEMPGLKSEGHCYNIKRKYLEYNYQLPEEFTGKYLSDGINEIPFMFRLPESGIPSTFVGSHGSINYFIEANIGDPLMDDCIKSKAQIIVESPFKDNLFLSVGGSTEKELGLLNLGSGTIRMHATLFKKGHTPGENAEIVCNIHNSSTADVTPRATLYQTQIFMTGEKHKTIETTVTEASVGETIESGMSTDSVINLTIPEDLPLSLKCPNITVKYFIHVTLDIPHSIDLHLNLPIVITNCFAINSFT